MDTRGPAQARYPWQEPIASIWPASRHTPVERRRRYAYFYFAFEGHFQRGYDGEKKLYYDEGVGFYRFGVGTKEGEFALSNEYADWEGLREVGYFDGPGS